ncbi:MAG: slipin family protein [Candidatus Gastranaerophilales bacterium]|nr:slipin family protein [Candidatus Gastranaerophilales bacterium]
MVSTSFESYPERSFAKPTSEHVSLGKGIRGLVFGIPAAISIFFALIIIASGVPGPFVIFLEVIFLGFLSVFVNGIRIAAQWEKAVILRLGSFYTVKGPGIFYVIPFIDYAKFLDMRILTLNIPKQSVITKDNVPVEIDGVVFFKVDDAQKSIISIQDYRFAISQYAQNSLRDVAGGLSLDEILSERERVQMEVYEHFKGKVMEWGLQVDSVRILDIQMPEDLKRVMSRQASAEREKRATIIKAEGDKLASANLSEAARIMTLSPGAMELRTLQTIDGLGASPSNTVILFPVEIVKALESIKGVLKNS